MDQTSALQQQFPLSPKKFWKKILNQIIGIVLIDGILGVLMGFAIYFVFVALTTTSNDDIGYIPMILCILGMIVLLFVVHFGLYSWYIKTYIKRYYYAGEENFITIKKGVFAPTEIHVQWKKIQDVYVDQDILDRIMGLYDVHIASATATSGIEAHIDGVDKDAAEGLKKLFLDKMTTTSVQGSPISSVQSQPLQSTDAPKTINLSEEISSKVYPLSGTWTTVELISRIIGSFFTAAVITFILVVKSKDGSLFNTNFGYIILAWVVLGIIVSIYSIVRLFLWKKNYSFSFSPDNIYFKEGILSLSEKHMPYSSIQDVTVQQGILERFVGLAKVKIENAATQSVMTKNGTKAVFTGVIIQGLSIENANKITDLLKTTVLGKNTSKYGV